MDSKFQTQFAQKETEELGRTQCHCIHLEREIAISFVCITKSQYIWHLVECYTPAISVCSQFSQPFPPFSLWLSIYLIWLRVFWDCLRVRWTTIRHTQYACAVKHIHMYAWCGVSLHSFALSQNFKHISATLMNISNYGLSIKVLFQIMWTFHYYHHSVQPFRIFGRLNVWSIIFDENLKKMDQVHFWMKIVGIFMRILFIIFKCLLYATVFLLWVCLVIVRSIVNFWLIFYSFANSRGFVSLKSSQSAD